MNPPARCRIIPICVVYFVIQAVASLDAEVRPAWIFGDNMVLQRGSAAPVWGTADPGERVTVSVTAGAGAPAAAPLATAETTAGVDGKWRVNITGLPASKRPVEVSISGARNRVVFRNVLLGDVWLCCGQSNMDMGILRANAAEEEIAKATHPEIRFLVVNTNPAPAPLDAPLPSGAPFVGKWIVCSPESVAKSGFYGGFSAVGYYFGRDIAAFTGQPVGLINASRSGTPAEIWMSLEALQSSPRFAPLAERAAIHRRDYDKNLREFDEKLAIARASQKPGAPPPAIGRSPQWNIEMPTVLFNSMIAPLIPYGAKGFIWYQGEGNASRPGDYAALLSTMIADWRGRWDQPGGLSFLIVQLANFRARQPFPVESNWALIREAQAEIAAQPGNALAVAIDLGEADDVHPKNKRDVGARLALAARKTAYADKTAAAEGPVFERAVVEDKRIRIFFTNTDGGLVARPTSGDGDGVVRLKDFAIAGTDKKFVWADARIENDSVVVSSSKIAAPVFVRYAWADNPDCNLYNLSGLPAVPFRTDEKKAD